MKCLLLLLPFFASQVLASEKSLIVHKVKAVFGASNGNLKNIAFEVHNIEEGKSFACHASDMSFASPGLENVRDVFVRCMLSFRKGDLVKVC